MHDAAACARKRLPLLSRRGWRHAAMLAALLAGALAASGDARAQAGRVYQVEVVVFSHPPGTSAELPPLPRIAPPDLADAELGEDSRLDAGDDDLVAPPAEHQYTLPVLPEGYTSARLPLALGAVASRLNRGGYQLLWHQAWVQPPSAQGSPELAVLAALGQGPASQDLSGTVHLLAGRFLHLGLDLKRHSAGRLEAEMLQRRRIRLSAHQYFDHPHIGVIAIVVPVEAGTDQSPPTP